MASFRIFGMELDFHALSEELKISPSLTRRKGEHGLTRTPRTMDVWCVDSPCSRAEPLEVHLEWLGQALAPHYDFLRSVKPKYDLSTYCGISVEGERSQFRVPPSALRFLVDLGSDMDLSYVFTGYSDLGPQDKDAAPLQVPFDSEGADTSIHVVGTALGLYDLAKTLSIDPSLIRRDDTSGALREVHPANSYSIVASVPQTNEIDMHLRSLGEMLIPRSEIIRSLRGGGAEVFVQYKFITRSAVCGFVISPEGLQICTDISLPLEFDGFLIWRSE